MSKLIKLRPIKRNHVNRDYTEYDKSAPFFENPRGVLIHRVKSLYEIRSAFGESWLIVDYWCENHGRTTTEFDGLLFDPGDKLICVRCEFNATSNGEKPSTEIAGRHVCTGVVRPINTCCPNKRNRN